MKNKLSTYINKRDFNKTPEPVGKIKNSQKGLHYVMQFHAARKDHYDFRLEWNGVLLSWAVPKGPSLNPQDKRLAVQTEDHPLDYRNFEGNIPLGQYGGGTVLLFDSGYWNPLNDVKKGLKEGLIKFVLKGKRLMGKFMLVRMEKDNWLLIKEKDEFAQKTNGISQYKTSVKSGKTFKEIANLSKNPFSKINVELALLSETVPNGRDWLYEIKFDGYRIIGEIENKNVVLYTRNHQNYTSKFPSIEKSLIELSQGRAMILDGEIVFSDETGRSNFFMLQNAIKIKDTSQVDYVVFDILSLDGEDLRDLPLIERKMILENLLKKANKNIIYSRHLIGNGEVLLDKVKQLSLEGIIAKKKNSVYSGKRSGNWLKIKCRKSSEFIIGGYELSNKKEGQIKSLYLGEYKNEQFVYVGKVGSGIDRKKSQELIQLFKSYTTKKTYFEKGKKDIIYLKPHFICEVEFAEFTTQGLLRQASFKAIREDKKVKDLKNKDTEIEITSPDKIIYPLEKIRKIDIVEYYQQVAPYMMKYIINRPLAAIRCNQGIDKTFFKKHPDKNKLGIDIFSINNKEGKKQEYYSINEKLGIIEEVQSGTLEFHIWGCTKDNLNEPDYMVFDLDPDEGMELSQVRRGVKHLKMILDDCHLTSFLKTSGGKGYHVIVPFSQVKDWDTFEDFSHKIALLMESMWPSLYTTNMSKQKRKNKIFIDWLRNKKGSTSVAPYSLRARDNASVSMPIAWSELDKIAPDEITIKEVLMRLKKNPWRNFMKIKEKQKLL